MMNMAIELHDTFVSEVERGRDGSGEILLRAVVHRSEGTPGEDAHESGWQNVRLRFTDMVVDDDLGDGKDYIAEGFLSVNGERQNGLIPFPIHHVGEILLSIVVSVRDEFPTVTVRGSSLSIAEEGKFELEHIWDAEGNPRSPNA